jgi:outer membrane lipoprotein-sorting protein
MFEALLLAALLQSPPAAGAAPSPVATADRALLARTDPFGRAPKESRSRLAVRAGGKAVALEIWRRGDRALVRFLDPAEKGKYILRLAEGTYFIAPGARQPIRLPPGHRLAGAVALDELLGVPLEANYEIGAVTRRDPSSAVVEFDLRGTSKSLAYPRLRWVVDEKAQLPLRADLQLADGRVARVLEWKTWRDRAALQPGAIVIKDVLRQDAPAEVEVIEFESRQVPAELFSLTDPSARSALPPPT